MRLPESRMKENFHVRFGGGWLEKEPQGHLASHLPNCQGLHPRAKPGPSVGCAEKCRLYSLFFPQASQNFCYQLFVQPKTDFDQFLDIRFY